MRTLTETERTALMSLDGVFKDEEERRKYVTDAWPRLAHTVRCLEFLEANGVRRLLELGSNPYLLTVLTRRLFSFDVELANYFGESLPGPGPHVHGARLLGEPVEFPFTQFNAEKDPFPYPDASLDAVLFCEILEHLLVSPDHVLSEIGRVVRPGGFVVVTTPNATRLTNLYFLAMGRNIWDGYSHNGPYGRHNREFTAGEITELLDRHGFDACRVEAHNLWPLARRFTYLQWLRPIVWYEHLFVIGRRRAVS